MSILRKLGGWAAAVVLLVGAAPGASLAQTDDHLSCYPVRVKGSQWSVVTDHASEPLTLDPLPAPFAVDEGCRLLQPRRLRPRQVCVPSDVAPRQAPGGANLAQVFACYAIRCKSGSGVSLAFTTQFGSGERYVRREGGVRTLCVPTLVAGMPTPTPGSTSTPSATPTPAATTTPAPTPTSATTPTMTPAPTSTTAPTPTPGTAPTATPGQASPTPPASTPTATPQPTPSLQPCGVDSQCVFVSSALYNGGQIEGEYGANAKCQTLAEAANLTGTYNAWLATTTSSPSSALPHASMPYKRLDGVTVASSWADLTDGGLSAPIKVTEQGTVLASGSGTNVWTASDVQGAYASPSCEDFTSQSFVGRVGSALASNATWTANGTTSCLDPGRLYCVQVSQVAPTPTPTPSPRVTPSPTPTRSPNPDPPLTCLPNVPSAGMVTCYPNQDVAFDLYTDLLAAVAKAGVSGVNDSTRLHVVAVGGDGGNGKSKPGCTGGTGGEGGFATTVTRVKDIARFKSTTTVQWLTADSGSHDKQGGTGGSSSIVWMAGSSSTAPVDTNILVLAGGGGGGGGCNLFTLGHDGGHGGFVNGEGSADNGQYEDYVFTTNLSMFVGAGEDGHGNGGHPGSESVGGAPGPDYDGQSGASGDAGEGFGGRGGRTNESGPPQADGGGWTLWSGGSVDGSSVIGTTGRGSDKFLGFDGGAGGGGFGGGGTGTDGSDTSASGGGAGGGSVVVVNTVFGATPLTRQQVQQKVAFVFVK